MEQSLFAKTLELLKIVNDLEQRGHKFDGNLVKSLVAETIKNYNKEYAPQPVEKAKPEQVEPKPVVEDRKER